MHSQLDGSGIIVFAFVIGLALFARWCQLKHDRQQAEARAANELDATRVDPFDFPTRPTIERRVASSFDGLSYRRDFRDELFAAAEAHG